MTEVKNKWAHVPYPTAPRLIVLQRFQFVSPYPLDECVRQLNLAYARMSDPDPELPEFALVVQTENAMSLWANGRILSDGKRTRVAGVVGIGAVAFIKLLVCLLLPSPGIVAMILYGETRAFHMDLVSVSALYVAVCWLVIAAAVPLKRMTALHSVMGTVFGLDDVAAQPLAQRKGTLPDKAKKPVPVRLNPPKRLLLRRRYAFLSPLPLDVVARHMQHMDWRNAGISPLAARSDPSTVRAGLRSSGMDDLEFALAVSEQHLSGVWSVGTMADVDGRWTWVEGELGISADRLMAVGLLAVVTGSLLFVALAELMPGFPVGVLWLLHLLAFAYFGLMERGLNARAYMERQMRAVFGLGGWGPLPTESPPQTTGDEHPPTA
jgi:hypothetical protein